jgi:hypothetical protein
VSEIYMVTIGVYRDVNEKSNIDIDTDTGINININIDADIVTRVCHD